MDLQSISGLIIGVALIIIGGYLRWYSNFRIKAVNWIVLKIYRNGPMSDQLANRMFMTLTSILLSTGAILVILSLIYLQIL